jgi:nitroimidazol reductase NimA-like FMN-containing flavoprotein (pyridoxamine 5'-phosphate oxidase superfamily)
MEEDIKEQIVDYLSRRKFITLATSTIDGKPLTHTLAYVNKGPTLYFSTGSQSRKVNNIQENPNVAYSVYDETEYLDEIRSVQMEGEAILVSNKEEFEEITKMMKQKFPSMADMSFDPDRVIIKITPKICYFSDYIWRFGHREKVEF